MEPPVPGTDNFDIPAPPAEGNGSGANEEGSFSPPPAGATQPPPPSPSDAADGSPTGAPYANPVNPPQQQYPPREQQYNNQQNQRPHPYGQNRNQHDRDRNNGRRNQRNPRGRGRNNRPQQQRDQGPRQPIAPIVPDSETTGWYDPQRDGGFVRRASNSYLSDPSDAYVQPNLARQYGLRRGDQVLATTGRDHRGRTVVAEITQINGADPALAVRRPDFGSLIASYPERKLTLETGRPAKGGPELTRRAIDLIAPIGYGQRALIVAPARAGKTMLLQAIVEGVAINHPEAVLLVLLVDERPEEVSEMITWGYGEVVASSFDMPAVRHTDVTEMVLERARRMVENGKDVVIVLDSITRMARAYNTVERGTGRTLSGGLDATAMAKPKAFFGSARSVAPEHGGGSLTIIATALVETGSRMDDVIFEEFKGTGNCEIKLDRSLAEKRIYPAIDVATSGTRREDKLFKPNQLEHVYTLRRGLQQMPSSSAMEWLIKRIAATTSNDALLEGL
ncbi:MAG TPA: transcription termination factor Rho [Gemmatimonadaceae bacterium]|jgi:transcription termination factor Rho|nr:transcription termination factor Rho [Gemmatimonadaceae bacterium]